MQFIIYAKIAQKKVSSKKITLFIIRGNRLLAHFLQDTAHLLKFAPHIKAQINIIQ